MKCLNDLLQSSTKRPNVLRKRVVLSKGTAVSFGTVYVLFSNSCMYDQIGAVSWVKTDAMEERFLITISVFEQG